MNQEKTKPAASYRIELSLPRFVETITRAVLKSDTQIQEIDVPHLKGTDSLQTFLASVDDLSKRTEQGTIPFTPKISFDIFNQYPQAIRDKQVQEQLQLTEKYAVKAIDRFNMYTWSQTPEARDAFFQALRHTIYIAAIPYELGFPTKVLEENPRLTESLGELKAYGYSKGEFLTLPSFRNFLSGVSPVKLIEGQYASVPEKPGRLSWNRSEKLKARNSELERITMGLIATAQGCLPDLKSLGLEYRFVKEYQR